MKNKSERKPLIIIAVSFAVLIVAAVIIRGQLNRHETQTTYEEAMQMILDEEYDRARTVLATVAEYRDATVLMNYALARSEMDHGDVGQAEIMLETIPLDYDGDLAEEIRAYKSRGFDEQVKTLQSTMEWLNELSEEGAAAQEENGAVQEENDAPTEEAGAVQEENGAELIDVTGETQGATGANEGESTVRGAAIQINGTGDGSGTEAEEPPHP